MVILAAIFMSLMGVSIVNVALASIQQALHASQSDIQWVLSGYALTFGVVLVSAGRAGDLMGRGGFFMIGVAIFTLASVAAGLAQSADQLNLARLSRASARLYHPQGVGMIQQYFRGAERGRAFGFWHGGGRIGGHRAGAGRIPDRTGRRKFWLAADISGQCAGWPAYTLAGLPLVSRPLLHRPRLANGDRLSDTVCCKLKHRKQTAVPIYLHPRSGKYCRSGFVRTQ